MSAISSVLWKTCTNDMTMIHQDPEPPLRSNTFRTTPSLLAHFIVPLEYFWKIYVYIPRFKNANQDYLLVLVIKKRKRLFVGADDIIGCL